jgi:membrane protein implicated in regulation of membrane protease activity
MNMMAIIWLALLIAFVVLEAATVQLISTWFAVGALAAMIVSLLGAELWLQLLVFFTVSIVLLALLWPMARKHLKAKIVATNADALVGKICKVTEDVDPLGGGRVKVGDVTWSARTEELQTIPVGAKVRILKIQGVKAFVETVKTEVEVS